VITISTNTEYHPGTGVLTDEHENSIEQAREATGIQYPANEAEAHSRNPGEPSNHPHSAIMDGADIGVAAYLIDGEGSEEDAVEEIMGEEETPLEPDRGKRVVNTYQVGDRVIEEYSDGSATSVTKGQYHSE
jgi:hypothetical protein